MHDRFLDGLSDYLIRLSRVPGLGFLERHATAATWLKHDIERHLGDIGEQQQGLEEGYEVLRETFGRKKKDAAETPTGTGAAAASTAETTADATGQTGGEDQPPAAASALQAKVAQSKSLRKPPAKSTDAQLKQKLVMKTIKRRRF